MQERLRQQREEAKANPDYDKSFKGQLTKEEKKAKRKQILSTIGAALCPNTPTSPYTVKHMHASFQPGVTCKLDPNFWQLCCLHIRTAACRCC